MFSVERDAKITRFYVKIARLGKSAEDWCRQNNKSMYNACVRKQNKFRKQIRELENRRMQDDPEIFILS